jgi:hypothetical protein
MKRGVAWEHLRRRKAKDARERDLDPRSSRSGQKGRRGFGG